MIMKATKKQIKENADAHKAGIVRPPESTSPEDQAAKDIQMAVEEINATLQKYGVALQPYLDRPPYATIARVRIVKQAPEPSPTDVGTQEA